MSKKNTRKKPAQDIVIAYPLGLYRDRFVSRRCYETNLLKLMSESVTIVKLPLKYTQQACEYDPEPDYIYVNIGVSGLRFFFLRESGLIRAPFLIYLHVVYGQDSYFTYLIPLLRKEDVIIAPSQYAKDVFLKISDKFTVHVVPYPLDVASIQKKYPPVKTSSGPRIAYMGRLIPEKGIDELIRCMPRIIKDIKGVTLDVIGPLNEEPTHDSTLNYVQKLMKMSQDLHISDHVVWHGEIVSDKKYQILSRADIFVNPSTFKVETFGVVNTEALACGLPVVCSRWSAFPEIITDKHNGFFVDVKEKAGKDYAIDRRQFVEAVTQLLKNQQLLDSMKQAAKKTAFRYDYHTLMPLMIKPLKKKRKHVQGRWDVIKDKKVIDFRHLYRRQWQGFIHAMGNAERTYSSIRLKSPPRAVKGIKKIRYEIFNYLSGR